jgi:hypothetical protein
MEWYNVVKLDTLEIMMRLYVLKTNAHTVE